MRDTSSRSPWSILFILACLCLITVPVAGQNSNTGEIRGVVFDMSGAPVPGASVTVTNVLTNRVVQLVTDSTGLYHAVSLVPGRYDITFKHDGFKTLFRRGIELGVAAIGINVTLEIGAVAEHLDVVGATPMVQTETAQQSLTVERKSVVELPNTGNNWYALTALLPGVAPGATSQQAGGQNVSVSGTASFQQNWLVDGGGAFFGQSQNPDNLAPPVENIAEINFQTHNFGAEYGNGVAVFNVITKSGTNQFHGMLYEYVQNDAFSARNFFAVGVPAVRWNRFGGNVGGPIRKDKAFFFFSYARNPKNTYGNGYYTVPTAAQRQGDFSAASVILYDPASLTYVNGQATRQPLPGNKMPVSSFDAVSARMLSYLPEANVQGTTAKGLTSSNFYLLAPSPSVMQWWNGKIDYNFSPANRLEVSVLTVPYNTNTPTPLNNIGNAVTDMLETASQVSDVWTINSRMVNEARFAFNREYLLQTSPDIGQGYAAKLGMKNLPNDAFPDISITGALPLSFGQANYSLMVQNSYIVSDTFTWIKGKHTIKAGGEIDKLQYNGASPIAQPGNFAFKGIFTRNPADSSSTGLGFADFLQGLVSDWSVAAGAHVGRRGGNSQLFINDDYKVRSNLTLNFGLRLYNPQGWGEAHNRAATFSPTAINPATNTPGAMCYAGRDGCPTRWPDSAVGFQPRLGLAWSPKSNWSIRAGYGVFDIFWGNGNYGPSPGKGWAMSTSKSSTDLVTPIFTLTQGPPVPTYATDATRTGSLFNGTNVYYVPSDMPMAFAQEWQFDVQHQFWGGLVVDAAYVGSHVNNLGFNREANYVSRENMHLITTGVNMQQYRPFPQFLSIYEHLSDGWSNYNSFQLRAQKRFGAGLAFVVNYTYSKAMDTGTGSGWGSGSNKVDTYQQPYDAASNYALSSTHVPHILTGSFIYDLPFGQGRKYLNQGRALDLIAGGWQISSVVQLHSGMPFTPVVGTTNLNGALAASPAAWFANVSGDGTLANPTIKQWFNTAAYSIPAAGTFGNAVRNSLVGPGWQTWDASVAKNIALRFLGEAGQLQVRCEASDVTNHPNFAQPNAGIGTPAAGTITSSLTSRVLQLGVRLHF